MNVLDLAGIGRADVASAGGKGAGLGELLRAGVRVPDGFVVTTAAFRDALGALADEVGARVAGLDPADADRLAAETAQIRQLVESALPPAPVTDAVLAGYARLAAGRADLPVAVRSSATGEDGAEASFAGLQDTYLWVHGGRSVLDHVRRCWASLYSVESVTYRLRRGIPETDLAMAVVVQEMVGARSSGVMFTRSPRTGDRSVIALDASWGLGSAVVGGEVTPDSFVVNKVTGEIVGRTVASKTCWHQPDPSGHGIAAGEVPARLRDVASVDDEEIAELVAVARRVEAHYGCPQDIEWAVSRTAPEGENVFVLQSRPETVWAEKDAARRRPAPAARPFDHVVAMLGGHRPSGT